jgi:predicted metal-dependent hydrolase
MPDFSDYKLIRSARRTLSIQITRDGEIIVKAPYFVPSGMIRNYVSEKRDWIVKHATAIRKMPVKRTDGINEGDEFLYLGKQYRLRVTSSGSITVTDTLNVPGAVMFRANKELTVWYMKQAKEIITQRINEYSDLMQTGYKTVTFSDTSSKWGSCSHDNRLQFSWRLVMAPMTVIDYVCVHELAHTKEKNHGRGFWKLVGVYKPAYRQYVKWLKENSRLLHSVI